MKRIKKQLILLFLISSSLLIHGQIQIGQDIDGLNFEDYFAFDVSLSSDGNFIAISGYGGTNPEGRVRVFENIDSVWTLYGTDINGENFGGIAGINISLSSNGNTLAVSGWDDAIKVYGYDTDTGFWTPKGSDITNTTSTGGFGNSIDISSDGNTIIIGIPGSGHPPEPAAGIAQIFHYDAGTWNQIGDNIIGIAPERSGRRVTMSSDGNIVAVGNNNSVRIYENISGVWAQLGDEISTYETSELSLSSNGNLLAIGESEFTDSLIQRGRVRVYSNDSGTWNQVGSDIFGEVAHYRTGWSVSLSSNGQVLAIGEIGSVSGSTDKGRTRVFENREDSWVQIGNEIFGEASLDYSGWSVSLSSDASTLAIGAPYNDGNGVDSGHARVYELSSLLSVNDIVQTKIRLFPNPVNEQFTIQLQDGVILNRADIYNSLGALVYSSNTNVISTSKLSTGIYYVEIFTNKGKTTKKVVIR